MKFVVCVKQVPDTTTRVQIAADGCNIEEKGVTFIVNPYDEFAIEEALRQKEAQGGEVILVCLGPPRAVDAVRHGLAMGADRAIHIKDPLCQDSDPLATAKILAKAIAPLQPDVILTGKCGIGDDNAQTASMLAEILDWPQINGASHIQWLPGKVIAKRDIEGGLEVVESPLPAVISAQKGLNEPRYPSLKGIMAAKKKEIQEPTAASLGLAAEQVGRQARKEVRTGLALPPARGGGKILSGEAEQTVAEMIELLHREAKLI